MKRRQLQQQQSMVEEVREYLARIGRRGGIASRRELTKTQARQMVAIRETKRAALEAGVSLAEVSSWKLTIAPAQPPALRLALQLKKGRFGRGLPTYPRVPH